MPANPLLRSIQSAVRMNETLGGLFAQAGEVQSNKGFIVTAYRNANRVLPHAILDSNPRRAVEEMMHGLRSTIKAELRSTLEASFQTGLDESAKQLRFYGVDTQPGISPYDLSKQVDSAVGAVLSQVDAQEQTILAMIASEMDTVLITGDESRLGVLKPADVITGASFWIAGLLWDAFAWWTGRNRGAYDFQKQSIAALDGRTTDCCLRAHGQIVPLGGNFKLTGTPRFANQLDWTPFHWRCRTSIVLYLSQFDDGLTDRMRAGADWLLEQRKQGRNPDQHPADAFWN